MHVLWIGLVLVGLAGCGGVEVGDQDRPDAATGSEKDAAPPEIDASREGEPDAAVSDVVLLYDLEEPLREDADELLVVDGSGNARHGVVTAPLTDTGVVERVTRADGEGSALRFPAPCDREVQACPRVHLEVVDSVDLDPGQRDFAVSFDLLVPEPEEGAVIAEQNVIQKGSFDDPGQWKIEFSPQRRVSCVFHFPMEPGAMPVTLLVPDALAVDQWYEIRCERRGSTLSLRVNQGVGSATQTFEIPDGVEVDIRSGTPILVGGQDTTQSADQFYGSLDNVQVEIFAPR